MCADAGFVPQVRHEVTETSTLVTLVAAGLGVAFVPEPTAELDITGVSYLPLRPGRLGVDLVAAWVESVEDPMIPRVLSVLGELARMEHGPGLIALNCSRPVELPGKGTFAAAARW